MNIDRDKLIKHMVNKFLGWKLPSDFYPDCGITFEQYSNPDNDRYKALREPTGTNLFNADQAKAMFEYLLEGSDLVSAHAITSMQTEQEPALLNNMSNTPELVQKYIKETAPNYGKEMVALMTSPNIKECVNRFLGWKLPDDFNPDCGIKFEKPYSDNQIYKPTGTNLFNAEQAKSMFEYVLAGATSELFQNPAPVTSMQGDSEPKTMFDKLNKILSGMLEHKDVSRAYSDICILRNSFLPNEQVGTKLITDDMVKGVSDERAEFEATFKKPPYEWSFKIHDESSPWAGNYYGFNIQCGWEGWQARSQLSTNTDGWVRVDDRLPEFYLYSSEPLTVAGNEIPPLYRSDRVLYICGGVVMCGKLDKISERVVPHEVTHWKPLPAPPTIIQDKGESV